MESFLRDVCNWNITFHSVLTCAIVYLHFCNNSALKAADLGFRFKAKCLMG